MAYYMHCNIYVIVVLIVLEVLMVVCCAKHLTVESYAVIYAANSHTY